MKTALITMYDDQIVIPQIKMKIPFSSIPKLSGLKQYEEFFKKSLLGEYNFDEVIFSNDLRQKFMK